MPQVALAFVVWLERMPPFMLSVNQLTKRFGDELIINNISFLINADERVGLIGPNGCGKTTILRIITGEEPASSGSVSFSPPDLRIGYLPQGLEPEPGTTVREVLYPQAVRLAALEDALEQFSAALAEQPDDPATLEAYTRALDEIEQLGAMYEPDGSGAVLAGLDLDHLVLDDPVDILSGGQKTRLGLARLLVSSPQILLLDEPTNHLDITALEWL